MNCFMCKSNLENKKENLVWNIFFCIGVIFLLIGIIICINVFDYENKIETTGVITEISYYRNSKRKNRYDVYVSYNVDGKQYESRLNSYSSNFYEGKEIDIYYDRENPNKIGIKSLDIVFLIFPVFGLIFIIIGGIGIIVKIKKRKFEKTLKETGKVVYANYIETIKNTSYSVNGKHPYNIICEWNNPTDNKKYIFKSKNIWINPENNILAKNIKQFPIYIDESNKKKYVIDIDSLIEDVIDLR